MSLTSAVFGTPGTTTTNQAPGTRPPGYQYARDFFGSLGDISSNPFPTYQGQLDPGLSPTLQNLLRQAQGYSQSSAPEILSGVNGSLGNFMNPSFANPQARFSGGAPDYFNQNPNQTAYNGGSVGGLSGAFNPPPKPPPGPSTGTFNGQPGQPPAAGQPPMGTKLGQVGTQTPGYVPQMNPSIPYPPAGGPQSPPYYHNPNQPGGGLGQPPIDMSGGVGSAGSSFGFQSPPAGATQGLGGLDTTDPMGHMAQRLGNAFGAPGGQISLDGGGGWGSPGTLSWPGDGTPGGWHGQVDPGNWSDPGVIHGSPMPGDPSTLKPGAGQGGGGQTYGGYTAQQLQANPALAQHLGAHAAGLWRAFQPGSMPHQPPAGKPVVRPNGRHPLNTQGDLPPSISKPPIPGGPGGGK